MVHNTNHNVLLSVGYVEDEIIGSTLLNYDNGFDKLTGPELAKRLKTDLIEIYQDAHNRRIQDQDLFSCCSKAPNKSNYCPTCGKEIYHQLSSDNDALIASVVNLARGMVGLSVDQLHGILPNGAVIWEELLDHYWSFPGQLISGPIFRFDAFDHWIRNENFIMDIWESTIKVGLTRSYSIHDAHPLKGDLKYD